MLAQPPSIKFAGTHLYTRVERDNVMVKCLAQEHNAMSPARTRKLAEVHEYLIAVIVIS